MPDGSLSSLRAFPCSRLLCSWCLGSQQVLPIRARTSAVLLGSNLLQIGSTALGVIFYFQN